MALAETAKLLASLDLKDNLSKGAASATRSLGRLEGGFSRIGSIAKQGIGTAITNLARLGAVGAVALGSQIVFGIKSLEDLERVTNATKGVIESTGAVAGVTAQQVRDLASAGEDLTTVDDKVIQGGENLLLTFTNIGGDIFPQATKAMTDMAIAMAEGDVASVDLKASALQLGKALQDPVKGMTALRKTGVSFTDEQIKQVKALVKSGDTLSAQKIILAEVEKEFGKAGQAAGTGFGADMRRFQDAVEDAQQALAVGLLPVIRKLADWLRTKLRDPGTLKMIEGFGRGLADAFDQVLAAAKNIPWNAIKAAMEFAGKGARAALDLFMGLPDWVKTAVVTGWGLNKLTGGALGSIVGELGKGLIKGVLGMNAGVVNINAGVVNGAPGGVAPGGGGGGGIGFIGKVAISAVPLVLAEAAVWNDVIFPGLDAQAQKNIDATNTLLSTGTLPQLQDALKGLQEMPGKLDPLQKILYELNASGVKVHTEGLEAAIQAEIASREVHPQGEYPGHGTITPPSPTPQSQYPGHGTITPTPMPKPTAEGLATLEKTGPAIASAFAKLGITPAIADAVTVVKSKLDVLQSSTKGGLANTTSAGRSAAAASQATAAAIRAKNFSPHITVPVKVTSNISVRTVLSATAIANAYHTLMVVK